MKSMPPLVHQDSTPLAERLRPTSLSEVLGQDHILKDGGPLGSMLSSGRMRSLILWGGPGCGKTTIARLLAEASKMRYQELSAIFSGVVELRKLFEEAKSHFQATGDSTLLFVDEIHRFNRSQQDAFLPVVESGVITLIGATTENPGFELNGALLSRCLVLVLKRLETDSLAKLLERAEVLMGKSLPLTPSTRELLLTLADGDGRYLANMIETIALSLPTSLESDTNPWDEERLMRLLQKRRPLYDRQQEQHYNLISALHKSLRGSDVDAALYWFSRMIEGGEDPLYIARRLIRFAYEDIGMADPQAALQALNATQTYERLGSPEGEIALAHLVIYLATAPKSNSVYTAQKSARRMAEETGARPPPSHILNAANKLLKEIGYGKNYQYDHDDKDGFSAANYFPEGIDRRRLYQPKEIGFEREVIKRLAWWDKLRAQKQPPTTHPSPLASHLDNSQNKKDANKLPDDE